VATASLSAPGGQDDDDDTEITRASALPGG
jgi:hypothetical protein